MRALLFLLTLLLHATTCFCLENIKVFSWWDYIPEKDLKTFELANKVKVNFTEYRSNDVAISKLLSGNNSFNIAIISGWVMSAIDKDNILSDQNSKRINKVQSSYFSFLPVNKSCFPYMWGTTLGVVKKNIITKEEFKIENFYRYRHPGQSFKVVDDKIEFFVRVALDQGLDCDPRRAWSNDCKKKIKYAVQNFKAKDFLSSVSETNEDLSAIYGWQGELMRKINNKEYDFYLGRDVVIGADYVCLLKSDSKSQSSKVIKLLKFLSSEKYLESLVRKFNYFSPFKKSRANKTQKGINRVFKKVIGKTSKGKFFFLREIELTNLKFINSIWPSLRYSQK